MLIFCAEIATLYTKLSTYIDKICPYDYYKVVCFHKSITKWTKRETGTFADYFNLRKYFLFT